jgi:uncharacterized membrane protein YfhO
VYENLDAAPRFFLTTDVRPYTSTVDFEHQIFSQNFQPGKTVLVASKDKQTIPTLTPSQQTLNLLSYEPNQVKISVNTDTPKLLFISDTYDTGWNAIVNGKPATVYRADYAFRGVLVPAGKSTVLLTYQPKSFTVGLIVSFVAFIFTLIYYIGTYYITYRRKQS